MILTQYAIRHIPTGNYIRELPNRRGGSFFAPSPFPRNTTIPPRLFKNVHAARCFLVAWLRGEFHTDHDGAIWKVQPIPSRKREEMEIVPVTIKFEETPS